MKATKDKLLKGPGEDEGHGLHNLQGCLTTCRDGLHNLIAVPDIVLDCQDMPEWHGHSIPVADELTFLGVILDRKLTWASHIEACTKKAKQLAVAMTSCARAKWGLGRSVVKQIYKGAVEPIMLNNGVVAAWAATLTDNKAVYSGEETTTLRRGV